MPAATLYDALIAYGTAWGLSKETNYGTPTSSFQFIPFTSEGIKKTWSKIDVRHSQNPYTNQTSNRGRKSVAGDVEMYVEPETVGYLLMYIFGAETGTPTQISTSTVYTHNFLPQLTTSSFTSQFKFGHASPAGKEVKGCRLTSLTFEFGDEVTMARASVAAKDEYINATATAPTYDANMARVFTFRDFSIDIGTVTGFQVNVLSGSVTIHRDVLADDHRQGSDEIASLPPTYFWAEGSLDIIASPIDANLDAWYNGTADLPVVITLTGDIVASATPRLLRLTLPRCMVTEPSPNQSQGEKTVRTVSFSCFHDESQAGAAKNISAVLQSRKTTAYN